MVTYDTSVIKIFLAIMLLTANSAIVGCFVQLQKKTLVGDAVSHAVLPGICISFLLSNSKNYTYMLLGALGTAWISMLCLDLIYTKSKLKQDAATSIILSLFFSIGLFLLSIIQQAGKANQAGLQKFIFGNAASLMIDELSIASVIAVVVIVVIILLFKGLKIFCFDIQFANSIGINTTFINSLLRALVVISIIINIQSVGIVLMSAMLIIPPAAANFWSNKMYKIIIISALIGLISGLLGAMISYIIKGMPTGPWIVIIMFLIAVISFIFSPSKGLLSQVYLRVEKKEKRIHENILKLMYQIGKDNSNEYMYHDIFSLLNFRPYLNNYKLNGHLKKLKNNSLVKNNNYNQWCLTPSGKEIGERIFNLHMLWETYLKDKLKLDPSKVHNDAEGLEHIITPEIEELIKKSIK